MAGVFGAAYYYAGQQQALREATYQELQIFADSQKRIRIQDNNIWWTVKTTDYNYTKTFWIFNPNSWSVTADVFWEAFPAEMTPYCQWSSSPFASIGPNETAAVQLSLLIAPNSFLGLSTNQGDVVTQIKGTVE